MILSDFKGFKEILRDFKGLGILGILRDSKEFLGSLRDLRDSKRF